LPISWDRFFWSAVLAIFVGLLWLKFVDSYLSFFWSGFIVVQIISWGYFANSLKRLKKAAAQDQNGSESGEA
jgi:hypothetical protein